MPSTEKITVNQATWTLIAAADTSGFFQNKTGNTILIRDTLADPTSSVKDGYTYEADEREVFSAVNALWCRAVDKSQRVSSGPVIVTLN